MASAAAVVDRLLEATNAHNLDALVGCFAGDYVNETPAHPARGFQGNNQVRKNWEQIFASVPDLKAAILDRAISGDNAWTEWDMRGTRGDGTAHHLAGVIVFGVRDGQIASTRFFLEPVDESKVNVDQAVREQVVGQ